MGLSRFISVIVLAICLLSSSDAYPKSIVQNGNYVGPPGSGSVTAIASSPQQKSVIYAAFEDVGVLRSDNYGESYNLNGVESFSSQTVTCLAVHPENPDIILAGTLAPYKHLNTNPAQIWRSKDSAKSWHLLWNAPPSTSISGINTIEFNPRDPDNVLAGCYFGLLGGPILRSINGGNTWAEIGGGQFGNGFRDSGVTSIIFDTQTEGRVLAGFAGRQNSNNYGLYESLNNGLTWERLLTTPFSPETGAAPIFDLLQTPGPTSVLYAGTSIESSPSRTVPLWRSTDGGRNWLAATPEFSDRSSTITGFYRLAYHPDFPNTIWAAQSPTISPLVPYFGVWPKQVALVRSDDLGATWSPVAPFLSGKAYPDDTLQGMIAFGVGSPRLLAGFTGQGLYRSDDEGELTPYQAHLPFAPIADVAALSNGNVIVSHADPSVSGAALSMGTWNSGALTWTKIPGLPTNAPVTKVISGNSPFALMALSQAALFRSDDSGNTWSRWLDQVLSVNRGKPDSDEIYISLAGQLLKSPDFGQTSVTVGNGLGHAVPHNLASNKAGDHVIVAAAPPDGPFSLGAGVFVSTDSGLTFDKSNTGLPINNNLQSLCWSGNDVFAVEQNALLHSNNNGTSWTGRKILLQQSNTTTALTPPVSTPRLHIGAVGTSQCLWLNTGGIYVHRSLDGGQTWEPIAPAGLPAYAGLSNDYTVNHIAVSQTQPEKVWVVTQTHLAESINGGNTWVLKTRPRLRSTISNHVVDEAVPDRMFITQDSRLYRSMNSGDSWTECVLPSGISTIQAMSLVDGNAQRVVIAGYRGIWRSEDNGNTWIEDLWVSNTTFVEITKHASNTELMLAYDSAGNCYHSENAGLGWGPIPPFPKGNYYVRPGNLVTSPRDPMELLLSVPGDTLYRSSDGAIKWDEASTDLHNANVTSVEIHPDDYSIMFAGGSTGGIYKSTDSGKTWRQTLRMIWDLDVNDIKINPDSPNECLAATDWGLWFSTDSGETWQLFHTDMDHAEVFSGELVPAIDHVDVFAALTHGGLWTTRNSESHATVSDWSIY